MFFLPFLPDLQLRRLPLLSIAICVLCMVVYANQRSDWRRVGHVAEEFCSTQATIGLQVSVKQYAGYWTPQHCADFLVSMHENRTVELAMERELLDYFRSGSDQYDFYRRTLDETRRAYQNFARQAPPSLTADLLYYPDRPNPWRMLTSTVAHADPLHLVGNLLFFMAFGPVVELLLGVRRFLLAYAAIAVGSSLLYSLAMTASAIPVPGLGLSGIVMGMVAMCAFLAPGVGIRCLLVLLFLVRFVVVPAWILALIFVGLDLFQFFSVGTRSAVNVVAHIGGAATGFLLGYFCFHRQRFDPIRDLHVE